MDRLSEPHAREAPAASGRKEEEGRKEKEEDLMCNCDICREPECPRCAGEGWFLNSEGTYTICPCHISVVIDKMAHEEMVDQR